MARRRSYLAIAAVVILGATLCIHRLDAADVCGDNEAIEGLFVQQMVEHGAVLFPLINSRDPMYKPPLFHWTATAIDRICGIRKVTTFNLRLPSALYATAGVALTMAFASGIIGTSGAIMSGLILAGSYQYISEARVGRVDMALTFMETLALFSFLWWFLARLGKSASDPSRDEAMLYLFAGSVGLAVLAKGPVGAMLPLASIGIFLMVERRGDIARAILRPGPAIVALAIGSSWYVACLFGRRYGFLSRQLGAENFGRFFGSLGAMPPWYYLKPILLNSAPLSLLVPPAVYMAISSGPADATAFEDNASAARARSSVRLLAIFWVVTVAFFTLAAYKRRAYLLPLWPASAVMIAWWIDSLRSRQSGRLVRSVVGAICAALVIFNFAYLPKREVAACDGDSFRLAAQDITRVVGADEPLFTYGFSDSVTPLLFYLDRDVTTLAGKLGDAPPGYVIIPAEAWNAHRVEALELEPVLTSHTGRHTLVLLHRGKVYAQR